MTDKKIDSKKLKTSSLIHHMGQQYLFSFSILVVISLGSFVFIRYHASFQEHTGELINISGQQRMLSQRIGLLSASLVSAEDALKRGKIRDELLQLTKRFEKHHKGLIYGDSELKLSAASRVEVLRVYNDKPFRLSETVLVYIQHAYQLVKLPDQQLSVNNHHYQTIISISTDSKLLSALDLIVAENENILKEQMIRLKWINYFVLIANIMGYLMIGIILLRPMLLRIKKQFESALQQNHVLAREVEERKRITYKKEQLATAVEQLAEIIVITDNNGVIEYVNPAFEKLTLYSKEEAIGKNMSFLKSGKHDDEFYQSLWEDINNNRVWKGTISNRKKNGEIYEEITTISPILDDEDKICNFVGVKYDVSREKELEKQLLQSQKMQAVGTMAGGIAHDFNNILASILGYTDLLKNKLGQPGSKERNYLDIISYSGNRAKDLVQQILLFSRQSEPEKQQEQLELIAADSVKLLRSTLPSTIEIRLNTEPYLGVFADETQLHQVIMNLCINASHAMPSGGELNIELSGNIRLPDNKFPAMDSDKKYIRLDITDNGCGMDSDTVEHIFDPFFSTKDQGQGTGLGMSVVLGIVESHEGCIDIVSEIDKGTTVSVYFPTTLEPKLVGETVSREAEGGDEHIVVVDDETLILEYVKTLLEEKGYKITLFSNSEEALDFFEENPQGSDLLITDYTMLILNGIDLAKKLNSLNPKLPIILSSGFQSEFDGNDKNIFQLLRKPYQPEVLRQTVRLAIDSNK